MKGDDSRSVPVCDSLSRPHAPQIAPGTPKVSGSFFNQNGGRGRSGSDLTRGFRSTGGRVQASRPRSPYEGTDSYVGIRSDKIQCLTPPPNARNHGVPAANTSPPDSSDPLQLNSKKQRPPEWGRNRLTSRPSGRQEMHRGIDSFQFLAHGNWKPPVVFVGFPIARCVRRDQSPLQTRMRTYQPKSPVRPNEYAPTPPRRP